MKQTTIAKKCSVTGRGLHKGSVNTVTFTPARPDEGITVVNNGERYALGPGLVTGTKRGTVISHGRSKIHTVEHMVSAIRGMGIDNITAEITGDEPPAADGSSRPYVTALKKAGLVQAGGTVSFITVKEPMLLEEKGRFLAVLPCDGYRVTYYSDFSRQKVAPATAAFDVTPRVYEKEISGARTFGFRSELKWLKFFGLIKGASFENAILMDDGVPVSGTLRYPDELTRHKVLDIIGDFGLLNGRLKAHIVAVKTGHRHNIAMVRQIEKQITAVLRTPNSEL